MRQFAVKEKQNKTGKMQKKGSGWNQTRDVAVIWETPQTLGRQEHLD